MRFNAFLEGWIEEKKSPLSGTLNLRGVGMVLKKLSQKMGEGL